MAGTTQAESLEYGEKNTGGRAAPSDAALFVVVLLLGIGLIALKNHRSK
jgi:hypothetical protein